MERETTEAEKQTGLLWKLKGRGKPGKDQFVICILVGMLLLVIGIPVSEKSEKASAGLASADRGDTAWQAEQSTQVQEMDAAGGKISNSEEYESYIENKLEQAIAVMEGAGKAKVMVTVNTSRELVVEKDAPVSYRDTTESDSQGGSRKVKEEEKAEETIYSKESDGSTSPYVVKTKQPLIEGVVVVAQGGDRAEVRQNITEAVMALFDIEPNKIKIVKMKSE